jgi:hypothetical protein
MSEEYKPKNKHISDIFHRLIANLPVPGGIGDTGQREQLRKGWELLEERINEYYLDKKVINKELNKYDKSKKVK